MVSKGNHPKMALFQVGGLIQVRELLLFTFIYIYTVWIQTLSEKVRKPPIFSKLYPKHFLRRYLDL